uniref:NADP-dependent oxidoreductase domain-containing protein n=1 Tax=Coccolithus braarudii TaxID=221442 RepID=A0A7S0LQP3_9EUKA|mmetsp:Transcript_53069/g.113439  ORF Transcript_53069/g.113439 Transcript_53069/m.113439 type:complete len:348 (+) Transcript_53069:95-1138(+)|eukprot:CAMPEP_0183359160 /NCGR_PEP_ID=MMETSP0164_2-20130417/51349_1 /TAXON_ID=221442 /ORGANISM="Coccolithus pelagicus ssp braarudi, Strain PLY182g" /LENGTH=347 /DNA_ID=CAMNT_0025533219 /DNA_START=88 /DNA_END=1131 /DNA_ORIENTATION=-
MSTFIDSAYPTRAAYEAATKLTPALRAEDESNVKAGFEKPRMLERCTGMTDRRGLGDGRSIPVVGLGLYYTPPGAATYDIVAEALKRGYRHLDTADFYENEADVGRAVRDSGIPRDEIHITSKVWPGEDGEWMTDGKKVVLDAVEASIKRLGTHTDLYLIHTPFNPEQRINYWLGLEAAQQKGLTKSIGVSNFGVKQLQNLIESPLTSVPPAANEVELHPFLRKDDIAEFCFKRGMAVIAYSPLARAKRFDNPVLARIAKTYGVSPTQVMVRWSMQHGYVPLPKSVRAERISQNADVFQFELTQADMSELDTLDERLFTEWDEWGKLDPTVTEITAAAQVALCPPPS